MRCRTPGCTGEHERRTISHQIVYQERTLVLHGVPAQVCSDCGEILLDSETISRIDRILARRTSLLVRDSPD